MSANNILPFAPTDTGTNLLSGAAYLAASDRNNGNQPGVASSKLNNKALRQSSLMASAVAQFLADRQTTVIDDATLTSAQVTALLTAMLPQPPVGSMRNLRALNSTGGANSVTWTADELTVKTALGAASFTLVSFSKTCNLAIVGAGGMDISTAPNGFVGVYAIYNPTTGVSALLATNATPAVVSQVYSGANMPAGYTYSALISVVPTTTATGFATFSQADRGVDVGQVLSQSISTPTGTPTSWGPTTLPRNAIECKGSVGYTSTAAAQGGTSVFGNSGGVGPAGTSVTVTAGGVAIIPFSGIIMTTSQTLWYTGTSSAGTPTFQVYLSGYKF